MRRRKKETERIRVDRGGGKMSPPVDLQKDLIVAILMSMVGVIMAVLICWGQHPPNKEFDSLYTFRFMWECPSTSPGEGFSLGVF